MHTPQVGDLIETQVETQTWRGEGLVEHGEFWLTIHGAKPGEWVTAQVVAIRGRHLVCIVSRSDAKDPDCSWFRICGGCQLWHLSKTEERAFKTQAASDILTKYAGRRIDPESIRFVTAGVHEEYRRRGRLRNRDGDLFFAKSLRGDVIAAGDCRVLTHDARELAHALETSWAEVPESATAIIQSIDYAAIDGRSLIEVQVRSDARAAQAKDILPLFAGISDGVTVTHQGRRYFLGEQRPTLSIQPAGLNIQVNFEAWFHPAHSPSEALYQHLGGVFESGPPGALLELGTGVGTISILAAERGYTSLGVDKNREAIRLAERNGAAYPECEFLTMDWGRALRTLQAENRRFDTLVVNPMREPLGSALGQATALAVQRVIYLGPSPAAAAKDIGRLFELGYELQGVAVVDLYPRTYHFMLYAELLQVP